MEEHSAESSPVVSFCLLNINLGSALKDKMCAGEGDIGTWEKGRHPRYSCFHISFLLVMFCFVLFWIALEKFLSALNSFLFTT